MLAARKIGSVEGYRMWSADYDDTPNALLALEKRLLSRRMHPSPGSLLLDAGSGTGRWMSWAAARGVPTIGVDACHEMILKAERKPALFGRSLQADLRSIPLADQSVDLTLCSFTLGYVPSAAPVFRELARVSRQVIVSDLHPEAARAGWTRSFRAGSQIYELIHYKHSIAEFDASARDAGLVPQWRIEASFGEPERPIFRQAGKEHVFEQARLVPAVLITSWQKR
jgi:SAM-dependent methyltransferase